MATFAEDLSCSDPVARSFRSSKSVFLTRSQADSEAVTNKRREHLLAVSSFLFALIWGFGAHLPCRCLRGWGGGSRGLRWNRPRGQHRATDVVRGGWSV